MMDELHAAGFKVMLWIAPFMSADQAEYRKLKKGNVSILEQKPGAPSNWNDFKAEPI